MEVGMAFRNQPAKNQIGRASVSVGPTGHGRLAILCWFRSEGRQRWVWHDIPGTRWRRRVHLTHQTWCL